MIPVDTIISETTKRYSERQWRREEIKAKISKDGILAANDRTLVAKRLARLGAKPELIEDLARGEPGLLKAEQEEASRSPRALERVMGSNDLIGFRFFEQGLQVGRSVGRVHIHDPQRGKGYGTGFLVSPELFLTNNHVIESPECAQASRAEFNYQRGIGDAMLPSEMFDFDPERFFLTNAELDYTLVAIKEPEDAQEYGWLRLISTTGKLMIGEKVNIIQHPNGEHKQLAMRDNEVIDELELFLHYRSDTAPGSSGSPVFNDQWEVVALHHSGVPDLDEQGRQKAIGGGLWNPSLGEHRAAWIANEGVRISRLVAHLEQEQTQHHLSAAQRQMLEQMLDATPPPPPLSLSSPALPPSETSQPALPPPPPQPTALTGQGVTWTIPLQVSVNFGAASLQLPAATTGGSELPISASPDQEFFFFGRKPKPPVQPLPKPRFSIDSLSQHGFSWSAALSLALASQLAYQKQADVIASARHWGFDHCEPITDGAAQCFVATTDDLALVSFRGTESVSDWLSNLNVIGIDAPQIGTVHAGFYGQFTALRQEIEAILRMKPGRPLIITGHSLGGAIAILAAATWVQSEHLRGLYTYGQPRAGKASFSRYVAANFIDRTFRFVNDNDVVPKVPPGYRHVGQCFHFDSKGNLKSQPAQHRSQESVLIALDDDEGTDSALTTDQFQQLQQSLRTQASSLRSEEGVFTFISDHSLDEYIAKIQKQLL